MFNEGVDLPDIDTIMMLRPTESRVLWLQQFGRGLRKKSSDKKLTVIDYIGNHRIFLLKPKTLLGLGNKDADVAYALERLQKGSYDLPPGCEVTYELEAIYILQKLIRRSEGHEAMRAYYTDFREREGIRPTASEAFHDGYTPRNTRASNGSWFKFVKSMDDLSNHQDTIMGSYNGFFDMLDEYSSPNLPLIPEQTFHLPDHDSGGNLPLPTGIAGRHRPESSPGGPGIPEQTCH